MHSSRDTLYAQLSSDIESFQFDERVARVFSDMIRRSVPGYATVVAMTGVLGAEYCQRGSRIYDLGCSLGAGLAALHSHIELPCELIGIDNSQAMIDACRDTLGGLEDKPQITLQLRCEDISSSELSNASLVVMHYTLQFIPPHQRLDLLRKIHAGIEPGGVLVLSEKLAFDDPELESTITRLYYDFKKYNGYSELEISRKRQALENVLIPETEEVHLERLQQAGFSKAMTWFQCLNFHSFLAFKER